MGERGSTPKRSKNRGGLGRLKKQSGEVDQRLCSQSQLECSKSAMLLELE
jgi:hypothetical protein